MTLDFAFDRDGVPPKPAATLILVRDGARGLEVFCVERNKKSRFLGGAIVFPGGKLDASDADPAWRALTTDPRKARDDFATSDDELRTLAIAACRETLEEAAILPFEKNALTHEELLAARAKIEAKEADLRTLLNERGARLDLAALHPFARWVTPAAELRRFDARFFLAIAPANQPGAHDEHETMASFWATPADVLSRFEKGEVLLAPPTHRTVQMLGESPDAADAIARADKACLEPVCPRLVRHIDANGETLGLVLPGDREHDVKTARVPGASRYVLRGERWLPEDAP